MSSTDSSDPDGWPEYYVTGPPKHMHALGVINLNFNMLEESLFALFRHPLMRNGIDLEMTWAIFSRLQDDKKRELLKAIYANSERELAVREHIAHVLLCFDACSQNRNLLLHSMHGGLPDSILMDFRKNVRGDWTTIFAANLDLETLRRVADEMRSATEYVTDIWLYLQRRDGFASGELLSILTETHPSLPEKPAVPRVLDQNRIPRRSEEPPPPHVPSRG